MRPFDVAVTLRAAGAASVDVAWSRYVEFAAWPRWSPQITAVTVDGAVSRTAPGVTGTVHGPAGVAVRFEVDDVDELARTWSWRVRVATVSLWLHHAVASTGDGCSTSLRVRGLAPVVLGYAPLARLALGRLVRP